jgi:hypothetical protein
MAPYILIGIFSLIGGIGWGWVGALVGGALGTVAGIVIGVALTRSSGGMLSREIRERTAVSFAMLFPKQIGDAWPDATMLERCQFIEYKIEAIFKRAVIDNRALNLDAGMSRGAILSAAYALVREEENPHVGLVLSQLAKHIENTLYP